MLSLIRSKFTLSSRSHINDILEAHIDLSAMAYQQSHNESYLPPQMQYSVPSGVPRYDEHGNKHESSPSVAYPTYNAPVPPYPSPNYPSQSLPQQAPTAFHQGYSQYAAGYDASSSRLTHNPLVAPSYQDDLVHRMEASKLSSDLPAATQWSSNYDTTTSVGQQDRQRGFASTLATGATRGYAAHEIHQKLSSHDQGSGHYPASSAPPMVASYSPQWPLNLPPGSTTAFEFLPNGVD